MNICLRYGAPLCALRIKLSQQFCRSMLRLRPGDGIQIED
jgi:hypothetical protein